VLAISFQGTNNPISPRCHQTISPVLHHREQSDLITLLRLAQSALLPNSTHASQSPFPSTPCILDSKYGFLFTYQATLTKTKQFNSLHSFKIKHFLNITGIPSSRLNPKMENTDPIIVGKTQSMALGKP